MVDRAPSPHEESASPEGPVAAPVAETPRVRHSPGRIAVAAVQALRPKQWVKNALLAAAPIFSLQFLDTTTWPRTIAATVCFCFLSSVGYLFNDARDRESDQKHPKKRLRPIASGRLPVPVAHAEMVVVFLVGAALGWWVSPAFLAVALLYFATTMSYSVYFKHVVILDVMFLASGFVWRAAAGAVAIDVKISSWLLVCTGFLALFLGFNKRRGEIALLGGNDLGTRKNLALYSPALVLEFQSITTSGAIISYALYTVTASPTPWLLLTLPYVLYGIFRYIFLVQAGEGGAPDETLFKDRPLLVTCLLYAATVPLILLATHKT
jgi:4-hydroxybenzoate polyprenyltransferase